MTVLSPMLRDHALALAERYLTETRPVAVPAELVAVGPRAWFVLQTILHGEVKVIDGLKALGFASYRPLMRKEIWHRRSRRTVERTFPLFNRYLFAELPRDTRGWRTVEDIEEIDYALGGNGVPCPVAAAEVERFKAAEAARLFDDTKAERFPVGSRVRALSGPFGGFAGQVTSVAGRGVVKAMIEIFGRMTPVEFRFDMVEPE